MGNDFASDVAHQGIKVALMIASPMLVGALLMGIFVSIFQAVTQINEQTLSFIPKILVIVGALMIFSPWMSDTLTTYTKEVFLTIPKVATGK